MVYPGRSHTAEVYARADYQPLVFTYPGRLRAGRPGAQYTLKPYRIHSPGRYVLGISIYYPGDKSQQDAIPLKYRVAAKGVLRVFCLPAGGHKKSPGISRALFLLLVVLVRYLRQCRIYSKAASKASFASS